jgi:hypothetical protein
VDRPLNRENLDENGASLVLGQNGDNLVHVVVGRWFPPLRRKSPWDVRIIFT